MQKIRFQDKTEFELVSAVIEKATLKNYYREVIKLTVKNITYQQAAQRFADGATWFIIDDDGTEFPWNDYGVAGAITDNRDSTVVAVMGKNNTVEQELQEEVTKTSQNVVILAGKPIQDSYEVTVLRKSFEAVASKLSDSDAVIAPSLSQAWNLGQQVAPGERRYYAPNNSLYKCLVSHKTDLTNAPEMSGEYWSKL